MFEPPPTGNKFDYTGHHDSYFLVDLLHLLLHQYAPSSTPSYKHHRQLLQVETEDQFTFPIR